MDGADLVAVGVVPAVLDPQAVGVVPAVLDSQELGGRLMVQEELGGRLMMVQVTSQPSVGYEADSPWHHLPQAPQPLLVHYRT